MVLGCLRCEVLSLFSPESRHLLAKELYLYLVDGMDARTRFPILHIYIRVVVSVVPIATSSP
jgi:hypothetical protein